MQFLAQLHLQHAEPELARFHDLVLMLFQCQNQPGMCDEWDSESGGNAAILVSAHGRLPLPVPRGSTLLPGKSAIRFVPYDDSRHSDSPDDAYCAAVDAPGSKVLGKLGGVPFWIQGDETPHCACGEKMRFIAQIESRGGGGINFGDAGVGYAFACTGCAASAKFLWQCM
jgi:hypothetical protein